MKRLKLVFFLSVVLAMILGLSARITPMSANGSVVINEIRIDQPSTDDDEYFELAGDPGTSLDGLTYLVIGDGPGGSGVIEAVIDLTGQSIPASGFFVAAETTFTLGTADLTTDLNFENSDNVTHLLVNGFTGSNGQDLDTDDDGTLDVTPWSSPVVDAVALVETVGSGDLIYSATTVGPDGSFVPGHAFRCDDDWQIGGFDLGTDDTPGSANNCAPPVEEVCGDAITPIYTIQGNGSASPLDGTVVSTEGVVTGDFQTSAALRGFFIQDATGDGDAATSDGIFVFDGSTPAVDVAVGDIVRVRGTVDEFNNLTELTAVELVLTCGAGSVAATPISLPVTDLSDFEPFEGMLVTFQQPLVISEFFNFDRFGEIVLTTERQFQPTAVEEPGSPEAAQIAQDNALSRITLDDGRSSQNPDPAIHPNGNTFDLMNRFRGGDTVQDVTGVLDFSFGLYRIQPTQGANYTSVNPRTPSPADVGGNLKVASFNVLNYFLTLDDGVHDICGPAQDQECRGADDAGEFSRQRTKILSALSIINADVFGLIEMENTTGVKPLQDIVNGLNDRLGAGTYDFIDTGTIGTDAIKVGLIYKPATVTPVGNYAILDSSVDSRFNDDKNRPVLAQTFIDNANGGVVTVAVNHLKSKGSPCDDVGDPDTGSGSGNCNLTRQAAAQALVDWLASDPTGSDDSDFLIMGDLNSYDKEDPIDAILAGPDDTAGTDDDYNDLVFQFLGENAYSYVFDGQLGYLDHALANEALLSEVTGTTIWHINADEPDILDYDTTFKQDAQDALFEENAYRSSDHDPVIVGLDVCDEIPPTVEVTVSPDSLSPPNHKYVTVEATVTAADNFDPDPTVTLLSVESNEADDGLGDGDEPNDIVIIDDTTFDLRAERSGTGEGRIYTITYEVTDACGNSTVASAEVSVPHDLGQESIIDLQFLSVSDWHAQLDPLSVFGEGTFGGAAQLSTYWKAEREANPNTLTLTAGDAYGASPPLANFFNEEPAVLAMNLMGFDVDTFGNHNFDRGIEHLQQMIDLAEFQYVSANLENRDDELSGVKDFEIFDIGGVKVAVIGITNPEAPSLVFPGNFGSIIPTDPIQAVKDAQKEAKKQGAQVFVVIAHMGVTSFDANGNPAGPVVDLANGLNGIDIIFGDHTDAEFGGFINGILVVENRSRGRTYARTNLTFDPQNEQVLDRSVEFVDPVSDAVTPDQAIVDLLQPYRDQLGDLFNVVVGQSTVFIPRADACGQSAGRTCESLVGNTTTDAMRETYSTDFAITNSGGLRASLTCPTTDDPNDFCPPFTGPNFDITRGQVQTVLPFGNVVATLTIDGAELKAFLENGVSAMPGADGRFPQVSGLCFTYDISAPAGSRVLSAVRQAEDGTCTGPAVDLSAGSSYTLATNDFMANGGDGYPNVASRIVTRDFMDEVVADFVGANSPISPAIQGRINCTTSGATACPVVNP